MTSFEEFMVRIPDPAGGLGEVEVRAVVDHANETITYHLPDGSTGTLDVMTARALQMVLWEAVFGALHHRGPRLQVERPTNRPAAA